MAQPPYVVPLQRPQLHLNCCFCWALVGNPVPRGAFPSPTYSSPGRRPQMLYAGHAVDCLSEHSVFQCSFCPSVGHYSGYTACAVLICCALQLVLCSEPQLYWCREFLSLFLWSCVAGDENYHPASEWGYSQKGISLLTYGWRDSERTAPLMACGHRLRRSG